MKSIKEKGVIPHTEKYCNEMVDGIMDDFGLTRDKVPKGRWEWGLKRCMESTTGVWMSPNKDYATQNCRAGLEGENDIISNVKGFKQKKSAPPSRSLSLKWLDENPCCICEFKVKLKDLYNMMWEHDLGEQQKKTQTALKEANDVLADFPDNKTWLDHKKFMEDKLAAGNTVNDLTREQYIQRKIDNAQGLVDRHPRMDFDLLMTHEICLDKMPPQYLTSCSCILPEEDRYRPWAEKYLERKHERK